MKAYQIDSVNLEVGEDESYNTQIVPTRSRAIVPLIWLTALGFPLLTLSFGGVHAATYFPATLVFIGCGIALLLGSARGFAQVALATRGFTGLINITFAAAIALAVGQYLLFATETISHPVVGEISLRGRWSQVEEFCLALIFSLSVFWIFRFILRQLRDPVELATRIIVGVGFGAALVALGHWFVDNGRLFGVIEPEHVFGTTRARWPFVNSNNLAHFLLPPVMILVAIVEGRLSSLSRYVSSFDTSRPSFLNSLINSPHFHHRILSLALSAVALLTVAIAIAGSQSKGGLLGAGIGLLLLCGLNWSIAVRTRKASQLLQRAQSLSLVIPAAESSDGKTKRRRRRRGDSKPRKESPFFAWLARSLSVGRLRFVGRIAVGIIAIAAFFFFFGGKGIDLLSNRLEMGLLHSKDDIRWEMYRDTLPMIQDHVLMGVGIGNWGNFFWRYMNPLVAGINPQYLHSDPMQLLAEVGIIGCLPWLVLFCGGIAMVVRTARYIEPRQSQLVVGATMGIVAVIIASFFDFPFRMPAICFQLMLVLAMIASLLEDEPAEE